MKIVNQATFTHWTFKCHVTRPRQDPDAKTLEHRCGRGALVVLFKGANDVFKNKLISGQMRRETQGPATKTPFVGAPICRDCLTNCWQSIRSLKTAPIFCACELSQTSQARWNRIPHVSVPVELPLPFFFAPFSRYTTAASSRPDGSSWLCGFQACVSACMCVSMTERVGERNAEGTDRLRNLFFSFFQFSYLWKEDIK